MNYLEEISQFQLFGRKVLEEQEAELKKHNDTHLISGKLARFTIFNAHLNRLKQKLDKKVSAIKQDMVLVSSGDHLALDNALRIAYADFVNEYLTINFVKDDHEIRNEQEIAQTIPKSIKVSAFK